MLWLPLVPRDPAPCRGKGISRLEQEEEEEEEQEAGSQPRACCISCFSWVCLLFSFSRQCLLGYDFCCFLFAFFDYHYII